MCWRLQFPDGPCAALANAPFNEAAKSKFNTEGDELAADTANGRLKVP
jgi:hypothetical protein